MSNILSFVWNFLKVLLPSMPSHISPSAVQVSQQNTAITLTNFLLQNAVTHDSFPRLSCHMFRHLCLITSRCMDMSVNTDRARAGLQPAVLWLVRFLFCCITNRRDNPQNSWTSVLGIGYSLFCGQIKLQVGYRRNIFSWLSICNR